MTREEREKAIVFLKDMQECTYDGLKEIRNAIKALEQEPCEDAVSRQAVLDLVNSDWKYEGLEGYVENLPPVTPTRKGWILVSERMPLEYERIIVQTPYEITITELGFGNDGTYYDEEGEEIEVLAWMLLPEPYETEMEDVE